MKKMLFILSVFLIQNNLSAQSIIWQPLGQQQYGGKSFVQNNAHTKIYKSTYWTGVYMSLDSALTWYSIFPDSMHGVSAIAIRSDTLFADFTQCYNGGIQYTANDGQQWTRIDDGFIDTATTYGVAVNQTKLFVAGWHEIYMTSNLGQTWEVKYFPSALCHVFVDGENVYVGSNSKVYISHDNGLSWQTKLLPVALGTPVWSLYAQDNRILAGSGTGLFLSTDYGDNWTSVGLTGENVLSCRLFGSFGFAGTEGYPSDPEIYFSSDSGSTWTSMSEGLPSDNWGVWDFTMIGNRIIAGGWGGGMWYADLTTGINNLNENEKPVSVFPNPANDHCTIRHDLAGPMNFILFDLLGKKILQREIAREENTLTIDTRDLPIGVYIWKMNNGNKPNAICAGKISILR